MKKLIALAFFLQPFNSSVSASEAALPAVLTVEERLLSLTTVFDLHAEGETLGCVHRKFFCLTPEYHFIDKDGNKAAIAKMRLWRLGAIFDITNMHSEILGRVEEEFSWFFPTFTVISRDKREIAKGKLNFWGTKYIIRDAEDDHTVAEMAKPFFQFKNKWQISIKDKSFFINEKIHPDAILTIAAFQVDMEYWSAINKALGFRAKKHYSLPYLVSEPQEVIDALQVELQEYKGLLDEYVPQRSDFLAVESIPLSHRLKREKETEAQDFYRQMSTMIELLSAESLTNGQKAALYQMIERRLKP